ncbi:MAG: thermostable hemolysin, partial [Methylophilus sp.]
MLNTVISQTPVYTAETAYQLRTFAQTKRYQVSEISAHAVTQSSPCRAEVEEFIKAVFNQAYGAEINSF